MKSSSPLALDLFDVSVPDIRTPAPIAPGSESSQAGARNVRPRRTNQFDKILGVLAEREDPISRELLCALTGIRESSMCGRLSELEPIWVERVENACKSRAGVNVNGYRLTAAGRDRARGPRG